MYYLAGDDDTGIDKLAREVRKNVLTAALSNENVNIVVFYDDVASLAAYWTKDNTNSIGEVNTGDQQTLHDFVNWAQTNYPAEHYGLVSFSHGNG